MTTLRTGSTSARARASGLVVLAAVVFASIVSSGHPSARAVRDAQSQFAPTAVVCVGADGVMHAGLVGGTCPGGQTPMAMSVGASNCDDCDPWDPKDDPNPGPSSPTDGLGALEGKVAALEKGPLFEVVGQDGVAIFDVRPGEAALSNAAGVQTVVLRAANSGGFLTAQSVSGELASSIGATATEGGILITEGGVRRVEFGKQLAGNFSLRVPGASGPLAAIGESQARTGAALVGDVVGHPRALMSVVDGKGSITIRNGSDAPVIALTEGESGSGMLVIGDAKSEPMVKFSVTNNRYGAVLAGPVAGMPTVPGSGFIGSYILGCAAGPGCGPGGGRR